MTYSFKALTLISALALSACGHYSDDLASLEGDFTKSGQSQQQYAMNAQGLNTVTPAAGGAVSFSRTLAEGYYALAKYENDEMYDYRAAKYYTKKAGAAMKGDHVSAGHVGEFNIPEASREELTQGRVQLIDAMRFKMVPENHAGLAQAQVKYDCWLDQVEENQKDLTCRTGFFDTLSYMSDPYAEAKRYGVSFNAGTSALAQGAQQTLDEAASLIQERQGTPYRIILSGQGLSADRQLVIQNILSAKGVNPKSIMRSGTQASKELASSTEGQEDTLFLSVKFAEKPAAQNGI